MTKTRDIVLGDRTFAVPVLPLRHNRVIYPLCRDLSADPEDKESFFARLSDRKGTPDAVRDDEWDKLIEIAFNGACAADSTLTRADFDNLPITPPQLLDAFFPIRFQTGAWRAPEEIEAAPDAAEKDQDPGEAAAA